MVVPWVDAPINVDNQLWIQKCGDPHTVKLRALSSTMDRSSDLFTHVILCFCSSFRLYPQDCVSSHLLTTSANGSQVTGAATRAIQRRDLRSFLGACPIMLRNCAKSPRQARSCFASCDGFGIIFAELIVRT